MIGQLASCSVCACSQAKATAAAEALGQVPPSHALLCCGCRAAVPAQMQLSLVEDTFMRMRGNVGHSARQRVQETMLQVSA